MSTEDEHVGNGSSSEHTTTAMTNGEGVNGSEASAEEETNGDVGEERPHVILRNALHTLSVVLSGYEVGGGWFYIPLTTSRRCRCSKDMRNRRS